MRKIRKRFFAAVLAAALFFTMPGMTSYAEVEDAQTKDISESVTVQAEDDAAEEKPEAIQESEAEDSDTDKPGTGEDDTEDTETDDKEPAEDETVPAEKEDAKECICGTLCTEDSINEDCPVCGAEEADLSRCKGEKTEALKGMEESRTKGKIITAWEWIDPEDYLTDGVLALPGASRRNPAFLADVTALLPEKIRAEVTTVNTEDGEETEENTEASSEALSEAEKMDITLTGWKCASYPEGGAYEGVYTFYASLPEGFVLVEDAAVLKVKVELGGAKMLAEEVSAAYQEASWNGSVVTYSNETATNCTPVADSTEAVTWDAGWYVVNSSVTISQPITVSGAVNLILADGCTLNADSGIVVTTGNSLTIYAQSDGTNTGTLNATGVASSGNASAGIGGTPDTPNSGTITIHGGNIEATGGSTDAGGVGGAGIGGGGGGASGNSGAGTSITISGGIVDTKGSAGNNNGNYAGDPIGNGGNTSGDADVTKTAGIIYENSEGKIYGTVSLDGEYTVPAGYILTFVEGGKFNGNYAFYQNGSPIEMDTVKEQGVTGPATVKECTHPGVKAPPLTTTALTA